MGFAASFCRARSCGRSRPFCSLIEGGVACKLAGSLPAFGRCVGMRGRGRVRVARGVSLLEVDGQASRESLGEWQIEHALKLKGRADA
jgi:hypothetical protein